MAKYNYKDIATCLREINQMKAVLVKHERYHKLLIKNLESQKDINKNLVLFLQTKILKEN